MTAHMASATNGRRSRRPFAADSTRHRVASSSSSFHVSRKNHQSAGRMTRSSGIGTSGLSAERSDAAQLSGAVTGGCIGTRSNSRAFGRQTRVAHPGLPQLEAAEPMSQEKPAPADARSASKPEPVPEPQAGPPASGALAAPTAPASEKLPNFVLERVEHDVAAGQQRRQGDDALSPRAERLPAHRPRQEHLPQLRHRRERARGRLQPPLRRHQPVDRGRRVRPLDPGRRALARLRLGDAAVLRVRLLRAALRARPQARRGGQGVRRQPVARRRCARAAGASTSRAASARTASAASPRTSICSRGCARASSRTARTCFGRRSTWSRPTRTCATR